MFNEQYIKENHIDYCLKCNTKLKTTDFIRWGLTLKDTPKVVFEFKCNNEKCNTNGRWTISTNDISRFELVKDLLLKIK